MKKFLLILIALIFLFSFVSATCGNGTCESGENECNCASDCGKCEGAVPNQLCQEYTCATGECLPTTIYNCCGNNNI